MQILEKYANDIKRLCLEHKVRRLYAFGSILTDRFNGESDIDLIVDFEPIDVIQYADNYFDLKFSLQDVLKRQIDLLEDKTIKNPYFMQAVNQQRKVIFPGFSFLPIPLMSK